MNPALLAGFGAFMANLETLSVPVISFVSAVTCKSQAMSISIVSYVNLALKMPVEFTKRVGR